MTSIASFEPRWVSAPGASIAEVLRRRQWSPEDLADRLGLPDPTVRRIVTGEVAIDESLAEQLACVLGGSARFWLEREARFRQGIRWLQADELCGRLPLKQMAELGWIENVASDRWKERAAACLAFFGVESAEEWNARYGASVEQARFRASASFEADEASVVAWLRRAEVEAESLQLCDWDPAGVRRRIPLLRALSKEPDPTQFVPALQRELSAVGVAVVFVRAPKGCPVSGGAFRGVDGRRIVALSARHLTDDHLWFSLMHELGHLMLHGASAPIFDELDGDTEDATESEANDFAATALNPAGLGQLSTSRANGPTLRQVIAFASQHGISAGIVVGQLQHAGVLQQNQLNSLRRRYRWDGTTLRSVRRP